MLLVRVRSSMDNFVRTDKVNLPRVKIYISYCFIIIVWYAQLLIPLVLIFLVLALLVLVLFVLIGLVKSYVASTVSLILDGRTNIF